MVTEAATDNAMNADATIVEANMTSTAEARTVPTLARAASNSSS